MAENRTVWRVAVLEKGLDIVAEAHVQHLVGLIEDDGADILQVQRASPHVVEEAAGGTDNDLGTTAKLSKLPGIAGTAVDGNRTHTALERSELVDLLGHLHRQLTRRTQDQGLRSRRIEVEPLDRRNGEGRSLAGAGMGLSNDIPSSEEYGNGGGLNW